MTAPKNATIWRIIGAKGTRDNPSRFLAACLPELQSRPRVLEAVTYPCYALILDTALNLTFGRSWRSKLQTKGKPLNA